MNKKPLEQIKSFLQDEQGATAIEYSVFGALISVVIVGTVNSIGINVKELFFDKLIAMW